MNIFKIDENDIDRAAPLAADFRVELCSYKGIEAKPDIEAGREDLLLLEKTMR